MDGHHKKTSDSSGLSAEDLKKEVERLQEKIGIIKEGVAAVAGGLIMKFPHESFCPRSNPKSHSKCTCGTSRLNQEMKEVSNDLFDLLGLLDE